MRRQPRGSRTHTTDQELVAAVVMARGRNRNGANKRDGWERELRTAYLSNGRAAANGPPPDAA